MWIYLFLKTFVKGKNKGQSLIEYILIATLIALAAVVALTFLDGRITAHFDLIKNNF